MITYYQYLQVDGAELFTIICLPNDKDKFPTIILRSPYVDIEEPISEQQLCLDKAEAHKCFLDNGYAVVIQHCRGRGKSTGDCIPYIYEREDSLGLHNWIREQKFYNGELYLCGTSYTAAVHFVAAPFASDIKGAVLEVYDCERYNCNYRNGFYKIGLHGMWYYGMYKRKTMPEKNISIQSYDYLPLKEMSNYVLGEKAEDFDEILMHPNKDDPFWRTRFGGGESHDAIKHAKIPILLVTGFYDVFLGGVFDMWNGLDESTKSMCSLVVHPFDHGFNGENQPIHFENGYIGEQFADYKLKWFDSIRNNIPALFEKGKVTYYKLFENKWCCDNFYDATGNVKFDLGKGIVSYCYDPKNPAYFKAGLSANFGGCAWQDEPNSREDIISLFTDEFEQDTFVKGKMKVRLNVKSSCEDTCFYVRLSLCKKEGYYGLRDDINQISNFVNNYVPDSEVVMDFNLDEHAFVIGKGEKIRIDISSSAYPLYTRHTNNKGLFAEQTTTKVAINSVDLDKSYLEIPVFIER